MTPESVFLDHSTGDFYGFDKYECQWKPKGNVGLHYSKAIEVGNTTTPGSVLVSKAQVHRVQATPVQSNLFLQKASDVKAYVDKHH